MRTSSQTVVALALVLCFQLFTQLGRAGSNGSSADGDVWDSADEEVEVAETTPTYDYPDDFYKTPAAKARTRRGRWVVDFEGSLFQDGTTGQILTTTGVDDELMKYVTIGETHYDWDGCLDVEMVAAEAKYPSPFRGGEWLIVRAVVSARPVAGRENPGDPCLSWKRSREFLDRE